jgi:hypothetical protein
MRSVRSPPDDFDDSRLLSSLAEGWGIESRSADYLAVGFGSYHWLVTDTTGRRLFVTVDDLRQKEWLGNTPAAALDGLRNAFDTALSLRDEGGLHFVIAPLPTARGETVRRIGTRHAVAVFRSSLDDPVTSATTAIQPSAPRSPASLPSSTDPRRRRRDLRCAGSRESPQGTTWRKLWGT